MANSVAEDLEKAGATRALCLRAWLGWRFRAYVASHKATVRQSSLDAAVVGTSQRALGFASTCSVARKATIGKHFTRAGASQ